jgi:hypothetical protein
MQERDLILRSKEVKIYPHSDYIDVTVQKNHTIYSYKNIAKFYINKNITISISDVIKIARKKPLYFTDENGYVVARLKANG